MNGESQNIFYISNNIHNIQIYNEEMFVSRGFKCKISLVNSTQDDNISKGGYEQKETISIPYRYFNENAKYLQEKLKIPSIGSSSFVDAFKSIPIYMKNKYDEYYKKNDNKFIETEENKEVVPEEKTQIEAPLSEPIEKLKEEPEVNIEKITEIHGIELKNDEEMPLEQVEKEEVLKKMENLELLKIEIENEFENITEKKKEYKELEMMKDYVFYLIKNEKKIEIENEKTVILKSEKAVVIIGELSELNGETISMKEYFQKEKIKGTPLHKELELI